MGFGYALEDSHRLFLLALHVLTDLTWPAIGRAYSAQFPVPHCQPSSSDCRTQWSRKIQGRRPCLALQAGQLLPPNEDAQVRAYLQAHGLQHLNALGQAYLNAGPPQAGQAIAQAAAPTTTTTAPPAPTATTATTGTEIITITQQPQIPVSTTTAAAATAVPDPTSHQMPEDTNLSPSNSPERHSSTPFLQYPQEELFQLPEEFSYQGDYWLEAPWEEEQPEEENFQGPYGGYNYPSP